MKLEFLDEIRLIVEIGAHPNVLHLLGCCTVDEPYYLITELMKYGDLLHFLIKCQDPSSTEVDSIYNLTSTMQVQIAIQISRGMEYISSTGTTTVIFAARNVLVGDHLVVKISDFGLADDIYQRGYKRLAPSKKRPVKWVSLETNLEGRCSIESDVWSFGIVLYEIYTLGKTPYENIDGQVVITKLKEGYRLQKPDGCPDDMYTLMLHCWQERPSSRPTFTDIYNTLDTILSESSDYLTNLDPPDKMPFEGGITNPSCFTDETDIGSVNSVDQDRYSSLLITSPSHMDTDSDYSEEGVTTYEIEQITSSMDPRHIVSVPTIIVNSSTPADERKRSTAFINESYESHPV
ncbi:putative tyrosine-protein kinase [Apostichopus japonicus]|uniref:Putative tyrosine-protein kinase n=1 Tax=Stichopus japonicus TaxID=307972 RepID=A0A2G8L267_STIJA|nr:putative tyrosine-protein kinase [Apostichopus japonicus]